MYHLGRSLPPGPCQHDNLGGMKGGRGGWKKNTRGGGGWGGEGRVESKPSGETANVAEAQNDATENSLEVPAPHR